MVLLYAICVWLLSKYLRPYHRYHNLGIDITCTMLIVLLNDSSPWSTHAETEFNDFVSHASLNHISVNHIQNKLWWKLNDHVPTLSADLNWTQTSTFYNNQLRGGTPCWQFQWKGRQYWLCVYHQWGVLGREDLCHSMSSDSIRTSWAWCQLNLFVKSQVRWRTVGA